MSYLLTIILESCRDSALYPRTVQHVQYLCLYQVILGPQISYLRIEYKLQVLHHYHKKLLNFLAHTNGIQYEK